MEGGQSTEDGTDTYFEYDEKLSATDKKKGYKENTYNQKQAKRKEVFFNQILAQDEIDRLTDEKTLVNFKRFSKDGEQEIGEIKKDENGTIKENLIIKGNNYLALHSLKKQFKGKVKLIYIDPPYNTENDGFKYNDNFKHSTWLTFMKNRLEVARELLREDGVMFVQCNDNEQAYLKVLMDEVFGRENFIQTITVKMSETSGVKMAHRDKKIVQVKEILTFYTKNKKENLIKKYPITFDVSLQKILKNYNQIIENTKDEYQKWTYRSLTKQEKNNEKFIADNKDVIFRTAPNKSLKIVCNNFFSKENEKFYLKGEDVLWLNRKFIDNKPFEYVGDIWTDIKTTGIANEGKVKLKNGKKPESLLQRIIEIATKKGDLVLDYHLGSGTTAAVAHKMGRQYIGIEQMDYIENIAVERLKKVIEGEQGGISKAVNWQGGGDFIYLELAKWNEQAKEQINACKDFDELKTFFDEMVETYFLNYNLKIKEFTEKVIEEEHFINLTLNEQKQMFCTMLDNNQMYVCRSEMEDKKFGVSEKDIKATNDFYKSE